MTSQEISCILCDKKIPLKEAFGVIDDDHLCCKECFVQ